MALFRRGSQPPDSLCIVLRDALTGLVRHAQVVLRLRIPLFGGGSIPLCGLRMVLRDALA